MHWCACCMPPSRSAHMLAVTLHEQNITHLSQQRAVFKLTAQRPDLAMFPRPTP